MKRTLFICAALCSLWIAPLSMLAPLHAQDDTEAQEVFDELFGADIKQALGTRPTDDDLDLATRLLEAAEASIETPTLLVIICRNVITLASKDPKGLPIARQALAMMQKHAPDEAGADDNSALLTLYQSAYVRTRPSERGEIGQEFIEALIGYGQQLETAGKVDEAVAQYRRADKIALAIRWDQRAEIQQYILGAMALKTLQMRIKTMKERVKANPKDQKAVNELVFMYLVELNDAASAMEQAINLTDTEQMKNVERAGREVEELEEADATAVAVWYEQLLPRAQTPGGKANLLQRAVAAYDRYLELHTDEDLYRLRYKFKRDKLAKDLEAMAAKGQAAPGSSRSSRSRRWTDLVEKLDVTGQEGWSRDEQGIINLPGGSPAQPLVFEYQPSGNYEIEFVLGNARNDNDVFQIDLPVGQGTMSLVLNPGLDGRNTVLRYGYSADTTATISGTLEGGKKYLVGIKVMARGNQGKVGIKIQGLGEAQWTGPLLFSVRPPQLRIRTRGQNVVIYGGRIRATSGKLKRIDPAKKLTDAQLMPRFQYADKNWAKFPSRQRDVIFNQLRYELERTPLVQKVYSNLRARSGGGDGG